MYTSQIIASGHYLPDNIVTNQDLSARIDTNDAWIVKRTGIRQRHIAAPEQRCSDLALIAAQRALESIGLSGQDIDLIVLATTTPDHTFPATATRIQAALGARGAAYDVQAVCAGFLFALVQADNAIQLGQAKCALVIGSEVYSRILDWQDRGTCVLFGDGAGAVVLRAQPKNTAAPTGILAHHLESAGQHYDDLFVDGGPFDENAGVVKMAGREVYRSAINKMSEVVANLLTVQSLETSDIDWLIPHQANQRIMEQVAAQLNIDSGCVVSTVAQHANISAATIPVALDIAWRDGRLQAGQTVALTALGGGFSWGGALWRVPQEK